MRSTAPNRTTMTAIEQRSSAKRFLRSHPMVVAAGAVAVMACIAVAQLQGRNEVTLALSYAIPLWLFTYATGLVPGVIVAIAVAGLWLVDASSLGLSAIDMQYVFAARLLTNLGLVVMAVFSSRAAAAHDGYTAKQEELSQFRRDLVAAFSHDLRTPLASIVSYLHILRDNDDDLKRADIMNVIDRSIVSAKHVDSLIGDMMGVEQSSAAIAAVVTIFQPLQLLSDLQAEFTSLAPNKRVSLLWVVDPNTPPLHTDRDKLCSVLRNLVSNALKFTNAGTVKVSFGYDDEAGVHRIEVLDTGQGIPPATLPHIFKRFYRGGATEEIDGFGFGLFVVKTFVDLIGGSIAVTSEPGRGTSFVVLVPRLVVEQVHRDLENTASQKSAAELKLVHSRVGDKARNG